MENLKIFLSALYAMACVPLLSVAILLITTLPAWRNRDYNGSVPATRDAPEPDRKAKQPLLLIPGVAPALISYAVFFAIQYGTALWLPSYLVSGRGFSPEDAARAISVFYLCVMAGRFISGILSVKYSDKVLLHTGIGLCIVGTFLLALPLPAPLFYCAAACVGLGCAPTFPSMLHLTPTRFGRENSQRVMGVQMAAAYAGDVLISPLIGVTAAHIGICVIPWFLLGLCALLLCLSEAVDRITARRAAGQDRTV